MDKGPKTRAGFMATTTINRHDFGASWNAPLDRGGIVVGDLVEITIDGGNPRSGLRAYCGLSYIALKTPLSAWR